MDDFSSGGGGPLLSVSPDRVNHQVSPAVLASMRGDGKERDPGSVHDKISQFNTLAIQGRHLERKTADAALKRAMLGREEAEGEMRRYRDEARALKRQVEEGRERERRVGERLETVMENFGRAKETHSHTQALWEKEIRRARKETFKSQSANVKLQEELKSARGKLGLAEDCLARERERSRLREQEAFTARYEIVGVQEQLEKALERVKMAEQERDAFQALCRNNEAMANIQSTISSNCGSTTDNTSISESSNIRSSSSSRSNGSRRGGSARHSMDQSASPPRKRVRTSLHGDNDNGDDDDGLSISTSTDLSDPAAEIDDLDRQLQWERRRAERAEELVDFMRVECRLKCCPAAKLLRRRNLISPRRRTAGRESAVEIADPSDFAILREEPESRSPRDASPRGSPKAPSQPRHQDTNTAGTDNMASINSSQPARKRDDRGRRSTIFCAKEGIFRTVSVEEAEEIARKERKERKERNEREGRQGTTDEHSDDKGEAPEEHYHPMYARTPSVEPPSFAIPIQDRISLVSLLDAPHDGEQSARLPPVPTIPTIPTIPNLPDPIPEESSRPPSPEKPSSYPANLTGRSHTSAGIRNVTRSSHDADDDDDDDVNLDTGSGAVSRTRGGTITTKVPLRDQPSRPLSTLGLPGLHAPSDGSAASFDAANPAMTPTMTREQALAQIHERRGRARSAAQGTSTPRRKMMEGVVGEGVGRNVSAPAGRVGRLMSGMKTTG